jgi:uncharacterized protein (DUF1330 family)
MRAGFETHGSALSRSFLAFVTFCLVLLLATGGVVWYVGPTLAGIVIDESRREQPYLLFQLLPAAAVAQSPENPSYRARFAALAAEDGAELVWQAGSVEVVEGSVLLDVAGAQMLRFPTGADLVQMFTGSAYRALQDGFGALPLRHLGSADASIDPSAAAASLVVLFRMDEASPPDPLGVPGASGWLRLLPEHEGRVAWQAAVDSIRGEDAWNRVLLLEFPDALSAQQWFEDPATVTERAIAARYLDDVTVLLVEPSSFVSR